MTDEIPTATILVIHQDADALDALTRMLESFGHDVVTAVTAFRAQAILEGERPIDAVLAQWDASSTAGADIYKWSLQKRYDLRTQFVFIGPEMPNDFERLVRGRCLIVSPAHEKEMIRILHATLHRRARIAAAAGDELSWGDGPRPTLLLAEDEPMLLLVMSRLLGEAGFAVTQTESGNRAIRALQEQDHDVLLVDWHMDDGSGADLYKWVVVNKPHLVDRMVFVSGGGASADVEAIAPGRPVFPKGQDSEALMKVLRQIAVAGRDDEQVDEGWE